ncbi:hypothetical protein BDN72DRAFT_322856 [Pluteus cervinus]|uniref:Uncharacterized protein n=1 Tax=Pluteus cervinus TaxID=181527 RepID=A0ACD3ACL8_9AGAR|nr:hypothetical protein BDN72DRAFT_322856 [Pluteus cervinus]
MTTVNVQSAGTTEVHWTKLADDILSEVRQAAKNTPPEKIAHAFSSCFDNADVKVQFEAEITDMANTTRQIKTAFEEVSRELKNFDVRHYKRKDGSEIGPLRPVWEGYYEKYKGILNKSMQEAVDLRLLCDRYLETVLPAIKDPSVPGDELKAIAKDFQDATAPHGVSADFYSEAFEELKRDLINFKGTIATAVHDAKDGLQDQTAQLKQKINDLEKLVAQQESYISGCSTSATAGLGVGFVGLGIALIFPVVAPFALGFAILGALTDLGASAAGILKTIEQEKSQEKLALLRKQLADIEKQKDELAYLESKLNECYGKIDFVAAKMGAFAAFWKAVALDAQLIHGKLNDTLAASTEFGTFKVRQTLGQTYTGDIYRALREALTHYAFEAN